MSFYLKKKQLNNNNYFHIFHLIDINDITYVKQNLPDLTMMIYRHVNHNHNILYWLQGFYIFGKYQSMILLYLTEQNQLQILFLKMFLNIQLIKE